jgi:hypothetical protein
MRKRAPSFRASLRCILSVLCLHVVAQIAHAQSIPTQTTPQNSNGTLPYNSYGGVRENVNLATGNLNIQIPSRSGRACTSLVFAWTE